jgi:hypothetical protein
MWKFTPFLNARIYRCLLQVFQANDFNTPDKRIQDKWHYHGGNHYKRSLTKQLTIDVHPKNISTNLITFFEG